MIAFLYNNPAPSYTGSIQAGAAEHCRELGYHLIVEPMPLSSKGQFNFLDRLLAALRPDSVFVASPESDDVNLRERLSALGLLCVRIAGSEQAAGIAIPTQDRAAGAMVANYLIGHCHLHIAMATRPRNHKAALPRTHGSHESLIATGVGTPHALFVEGASDFQSGMRAGQRILEQEPRPAAIFAASDEMALGVLHYAQRRKLAVPRDISVVGFDDTPGSFTSWPPLTTVRQPLE